MKKGQNRAVYLHAAFCASMLVSYTLRVTNDRFSGSCKIFESALCCVLMYSLLSFSANFAPRGRFSGKENKGTVHFLPSPVIWGFNWLIRVLLGRENSFIGFRCKFLFSFHVPPCSEAIYESQKCLLLRNEVRLKKFRLRFRKSREAQHSKESSQTRRRW